MTRRAKFLAVLVAVFVVASAGTAYAFWTASASGNAAASAGTLAAPTGFTATATGTTTANLSWTAPASVTSYTLSQSPGTIAGCSATPTSGTTACTATGLSPNTSYTWTLTAVFHNWTSASVQANATTNAGATATKLTFTTQPSSGQNIQATGTGSFSVAVAIQDASNTTVTSDTRNVTLAINNNPGSGTLTCSTGLTVAAVSGVATFTGCAITKVGAGYTLTASSSPSLTAPTNANSFNITAGAASKLTFNTQPSSGQNVQATGTGTFSASVAVQDTNGNAVSTDTRNITLAIGTNPSSGVLSCTNLTVAAVAGVASFSNCAITKAGTGYTLTATSSPSLTAPANANSFNITAGTGVKLAITSAAFSVTASTSATTPFTVTLQDTNGNATTRASATTVNLASTSAGKKFATSSGGASVTNVTLPANTQSVTAYYADTVAGTPTITVSASGLSPNGTQVETITGAGIASLVLANCVQQGSATACDGTYNLGNGGSMEANVRAVDQFGNDATVGSTITLSVTSGNTSTYAITAGATLTIDGTATPPNQSTGTFTVDKNGNANNSTTITVHVTSGASGIPDLTFTVTK